MIRVICDIRGLTLCWQIFAFVNRGDFPFWLNRGLRGSNGFNSPQGYKCAERQDRINKMQTKKLLKLARLPVRSALPIAAFTLITRTAPCLRQLPSCVAVYPRDTRSRRVLSRKSFSSICSFCLNLRDLCVLCGDRISNIRVIRVIRGLSRSSRLRGGIRVHSWLTHR